MSLTVGLEGFSTSYTELEPLYRKHYQAMSDRLKSVTGKQPSPYNPRLSEYEKASNGGWLLTFVLRLDGMAIGYSNIYLTQDMHNQDLIAVEDTIFIDPPHRGVGREFIKFVHEELRRRGCQRISVTTATDLRVSKLLGRMGYNHVAHKMTLEF
jgi:GNAT superfamily N-acetyltransferase